MLKLSIIIGTYRRPNLLKMGLLSLSKQSLNFPYEIIIVNDYEEEDGTKEIIEQFSKKLNIVYIVSRKKEEAKKGGAFRIAGYALNLGVKRAKGKNIIISCPEIFILDNKIDEMIKILERNPNLMVIPEGKDDINGKTLKIIETTGELSNKDYSSISTTLNTQLPFFMALNKRKYLEISGYDENFTGYCFDDADFVYRMQENGCLYYNINMRVVHLYHSRNRDGLEDKMTRYSYNKTLFHQKQEKKDPYPKIIPIKNWELKNIPKIAHFYWGEEVLPYARYLTVFTFLKHNPDWKIKYYYPKIRQKKQMWNSFELKYDVSHLEDYTSQLKKLPIETIELDFSLLLMPNDISEVFKSDLLRWHLLSTVGGLWSDMDILYFRSMTYLLNNIKENQEIDTTVTINSKYGHSIGFLMSSPNNSYYQYILTKTRKYFNPLQYQSLGTGILQPEFINLSAINKKIPDINVINIDNNAVYSYDATMISLIYNSNSLENFKSNSIGMHWYAGHPLAGNFITKITEKNYTEFNNVAGDVINLSLNESPAYINFLLKG